MSLLGFNYFFQVHYGEEIINDQLFILIKSFLLIDPLSRKSKNENG